MPTDALFTLGMLKFTSLIFGKGRRERGIQHSSFGDRNNDGRCALWSVARCPDTLPVRPFVTGFWNGSLAVELARGSIACACFSTWPDMPVGCWRMEGQVKT